MKMAMYGAGNIGRGFIGPLFAGSGYEVIFIDIAEELVDQLHRNRKYPLRITGNGGFEDIEVTGIDALNGKDTESASDLISQADIMATAVGVNVLKFIVPVIAAGIRKRFTVSEKPLDIIICENLMDANIILEKMIKEQLSPAECAQFDRQIGLVEASIGRMVPVQTEDMQDGNPLRVCVERYGFLPVDKDAFKGEIPKVKNMMPVSPFDFYIKRKLYIHNMGHGACAYLGRFMGFEYIWAAIYNPDIRFIMYNAMLESALALSSRYGISIKEIIDHIDDLLLRFSNTTLGDTCKRVSADPARKLSPGDRFIGAALLCLEQGISPAYICTGTAAAVYQYLAENHQKQNAANAALTLETISGLPADSKLKQDILGMYSILSAGGGIADVRRGAELLRAEGNRDIV